MKPGHFPICCVAATHVNQLTIIEIRIERGAHENASFIQVLTGCYSGKGIIFCLTLLQISTEWFSSFNSLSSFTPSSFSHTHFHKNWLKDGICEHFFLKDYAMIFGQRTFLSIMKLVSREKTWVLFSCKAIFKDCVLFK